MFKKKHKNNGANTIEEQAERDAVVQRLRREYNEKLNDVTTREKELDGIRERLDEREKVLDGREADLVRREEAAAQFDARQKKIEAAAQALDTQRKNLEEEKNTFETKKSALEPQLEIVEAWNREHEDLEALRTALNEQKQQQEEQEQALQQKADQIDAQAAEAKANAEAAVRADAKSIRDAYEAEREAAWQQHYDALVAGEQPKLDALRADAQAEAGRTRAEAQRDADQMREEAQHDADQMREEAQHDADALRQQAQTDADNVKATAQQAADNLKTQAQQDANVLRADARRLRSEADDDRTTILRQVQDDCDTLQQKAQQDAEATRTAARTDAQAMRDAAQKDRDDAAKLLADAQQKAAKVVSDAQQEYLDKRKELSEKEAGLKAREEALACDQQDLDLDTDFLEKRQTYLDSIKEKYSPVAVEQLNDRIRYLEQKIDSLKEKNGQQAERLKLLGRYQREEGGTSTDDLLHQITTLEQEKEALEDQYASYPTRSELQELRQKAKRVDELDDKCIDLQSQLDNAKKEAAQSRLDVKAFETQKLLMKSYENTLEQLQAKLKRDEQLYKQNAETRFQSLVAIDRAPDVTYQSYPTKKTLAGLVDYIQAYGATPPEGGEALYYTKDTLRAFLASMATSHLIILEGLSGTGKSSLPRLLERALDVSDKLIPVQSSWNDNRELIGYDNDFTKKFKETEFTKAVYRAGCSENENRIALIVLDEMNLARVEYYFADFLSIMEKQPDEWYIPLVASNDDQTQPQKLRGGTDLRIPPNLWFIGTANLDESTMGITDKVYDRAQTLRFERHADKIAPEKKPPRQLHLGYEEFQKELDAAIQDPALQMTDSDWQTIDTLDGLLRKELDITFGNRIRKQMERFVPVYAACGGTKEDAIDHMLRYKILRKLDERFEPYLIEGLKTVRHAIVAAYGDGNMAASLAYLDNVMRKLGAGRDDD